MKAFLCLLALFCAPVSFALDCELTTTRTACPGKEKESYAKCPNGARTCATTVQAADEKACASAAIASCLNSRFDITKYKKVTAKLKGQDFARGLDFCDRDATYSGGRYVVRDNFPFRDSADCK